MNHRASVRTYFFPETGERTRAQCEALGFTVRDARLVIGSGGATETRYALALSAVAPKVALHHLADLMQQHQRRTGKPCASVLECYEMPLVDARPLWYAINTIGQKDLDRMPVKAGVAIEARLEDDA